MTKGRKKKSNNALTGSSNRMERTAVHPAGGFQAAGFCGCVVVIAAA